MSFLTNLIPLPYRILAILFLFVATATAGFVKGITYEADRHTKEEITLQQKYDEQKVLTANVISNQNRISNEADKTYQEHVAAINNYYSGLLDNSNSSPLSKDASTSDKSNAPTGDNVFAEQCTKTTQQLVDLQDWVNAEYEAGK